MNDEFKKHEKEISDLLSEDSGTRLSQIVSKSKELQTLDKILNETLEAPLRDHCIVANFRNGTLVIEIDNGSWATQFRYLTPTLLEPLRKHKAFAGLSRIEFYISPETKKSIKKEEYTGPSPTLAEQTAELLNLTAEGIDDPELKAALKKLSGNKYKGSEN